MKLIENSDIAFSANAKDVAAAFQRVKSVVSYVKSDDAKYVIVCHKGNVHAIGISSDAVVSIRIENAESQKKDGLISVDGELLLGLIKSRSALEFKVDGKLQIKETKGRYKANLELVSFDDKDVAMLQQYLTPANSEPLSDEHVASIKTGVKLVELQNFYTDDELLALINIKPEGIFISCFDSYHVAQYAKKFESGISMRLALPVKAFSMLDKFFTGKGVKFESANGRLRVSGENFLLSIPETQVDDEMYSIVGIYKQSLKKPTTSFMFDTKAVASVENMFALVDKETKMSMRISKKEVTIEASTPRGSVADGFVASVDGKPQHIHIDPRIFMDLFKKVKDSKNVPLSLYDVRGASSSFAFKIKVADAILVLIGSFESERSGKDDD